MPHIAHVQIRNRGTVGGSLAHADPAAELPAGCAEQALVASQRQDCRGASVMVSTENAGDEALRAQVLVDDVGVRTLELDPGEEAQLTVPLLDGRATDVTVRTDDVVASEESQGADCEPSGPVAAVLERCDAGPARALVWARSPEEEVEVEIRSGEEVVNTTTVPPGGVVQRALDLDGGARDVQVTLNGQVAASGELGGCDGPVAGLLSCGTAGRAACEAPEPQVQQPVPAPPPEPPPPLEIDRSGETTLPRTGPWERALALAVGGALLLGGGVLLAERDRRRPRPSLLGEAIDGYRQRWWDQSP